MMNVTRISVSYKALVPVMQYGNVELSVELVADIDPTDETSKIDTLAQQAKQAIINQLDQMPDTSGAQFKRKIVKLDSKALDQMSKDGEIPF